MKTENFIITLLEEITAKECLAKENLVEFIFVN